ncbi:hypothetical protein SDJN02_23021, partial [Cucurbita argyrosperma subsp. argyrosperma]
ASLHAATSLTRIGFQLIFRFSELHLPSFLPSFSLLFRLYSSSAVVDLSVTNLVHSSLSAPDFYFSISADMA